MDARVGESNTEVDTRVEEIRRLQAESGLPSGWEVRRSKSKNMPYYFNITTTESRWDPPVGTDTDKLKIFIAKYHTEQPSSEAMTGGEGKIRARHLLVKHNESRNPKSWKNPNITRSKAEAMEIIKGFEKRIRSGDISLGDLATTESDCPSHSKRGDLYVA
ncbi:MAG: hypothetical protein Q9227_007816 [Pyrenula ochraceoflavens]